MLVVISPAKTLDFENPAITKQCTTPDFLTDSEELMGVLRQLSREELSGLMKISPKLADLNYDRNQIWSPPFSTQNAKQAVLVFKGDVYQGLQAETFTKANFNYAQKHLRILSGLYGLLRPLDLIQAYRLEMGTKLNNAKGKNLYDFWGLKITQAINQNLADLQADVLVNLASNEYFKAIKPKALNATIITPVFKDFKNGQYKIISFFAKKARGYMSAYIIKNKITKAAKLKNFDTAGYVYNEALSEGNNWVFTRDEVG